MCGYFFNTAKSKSYCFDKNIYKFNKLKHRGVDDSSITELKIQKKIFMGHHRLAINDLHTRSNQPFQSECGNYYVLFNGEIFNYKNLKKKLSYNFNTESDTEVILAGYIRFGKNYIKKLEGFFSLLILDLKINKVLITVDPTSVKSLYYECNSENISVSSELSGIIDENYDYTKNINKEALQIYLQYGYVHAPSTILSNIYKLQPGELIEFSLDNHKINYFKNFNKHFPTKNSNEIDDLIINSHKSRLVADVPISTMLSSGVDSTLSNYIYSEVLGKSFDVFTLGLPNSKLDESKLALKQSKELKLKHKIINVSESDIIKELKKISKIFDEPFADSSSILVSLLSKEISKKYKVAISSDGGDELLYGYSRHKFYYLFFWICKLPIYIKKKIKKILGSKIFVFLLNMTRVKHIEIKLNKVNSLLEESSKKFKYLNLLKIIPDALSRKILLDYQDDLFQNKYDFFHDFNSIKDVDYNFYLPSINFKNDRCGMQYCLEIREPLLNYDLVRHFYGKKFNIFDLLNPKKQFRKILINKNINISKKKHGFSLSQIEILKFNDYEILFELEKNFEIVKTLFNLEYIKKMIKEFKSDQKWSTEIWSILTFTLWLKNKIN